MKRVSKRNTLRNTLVTCKPATSKVIEAIKKIILVFAVLIAFGYCGNVLAAGNTVKSVQTRQQFIDYVAESFWNHNEIIRVKCKTSDVSPQNVLTTLSEARLKKVTGNSASGDYTNENISNLTYTATSYSDGTTEYIISVKYRESAAEFAVVKKKAKKLVAKVKKKSDYAKVKYFAKWIAEHVEYEYDYYTAYTAVKKGKGVCMAYAQLFQYLATEAGIECHTIRGYAGDEYHMWNLVKLKGKWYYVDVTFMDRSASGKIDYRYFLFGTDFCNRERTIETSRYSYQKLVTKNYYKK